MIDAISKVVSSLSPYDLDWKQSPYVLGGEKEIASYVDWFETDMERVHLVNMTLILREVQTKSLSTELLSAHNAGVAASVLFYQECKRELERLQQERNEKGTKNPPYQEENPLQG